MEFIINNSPELTMAEITKLLFNRNFLSDVQFHVDGKIIYAHSLELMKRSIVFQNQLFTTLGDNKLIPINDANYDDVYQFVQYMYTDECTIDNSNAIGLLKLAAKYKVIKLENEIIRVISGLFCTLSLYEYCLLEGYHLLRPIRRKVMVNLDEYLMSSKFLTVDPVVIEDILGAEQTDASEFEMFTALARWIEQSSNENKIELHKQRDHYDNLIRLIRFPVMTSEELFKCITNYRHLFKNSDLAWFYKQISQRTNSENTIWTLHKRNPIPHDYSIYNKNINTIFTVSCEMLLTSLCFGLVCNETEKTGAQLTISQRNLNTNQIDTLNLQCAVRLNYLSYQINLGESIRLHPNMEYTIKIKYLTNGKNVSYWSRAPGVAIFSNVSNNLIRFMQASRSIYDMYFKMVK